MTRTRIAKGRRLAGSERRRKRKRRTTTTTIIDDYDGARMKRINVLNIDEYVSVKISMMTMMMKIRKRKLSLMKMITMRVRLMRWLLEKGEECFLGIVAIWR